MILAFAKSPARRLATVGLVALMFSGCAVPTVSPTPKPSPPATVPPTTPSFTLGPTMAPDACPTSTPAAFTGKATVTMNTNFGPIVIDIDGSLGPNAAGAFLALARCGYYDNIIFHRIIPGFVIQAGDGTYARLPNPTLGCKLGTGGPSWSITDDPVTSTYKRGTVAMARGGTVNSGSSQFFIVMADAASTQLAAAGYNDYAIIGSVSTGMDAADQIVNIPTGGDECTDSSGNLQPLNMPLAPAVITTVTVTP
jgi:cyclophilin family peptidyl-prolyl cis-trans isomerase